MWSARPRPGTERVQLEAARGQHPLEQLLGARLVERHLAGARPREHRGLALDADHVEAAVGEGERERQADPAEADDGDAG